MKILTFVFALACFSCIGIVQDNDLRLLLTDWTQSNPRISTEYHFKESENNLYIILKETSKVGSPLLEKISSDNLIHNFEIFEEINLSNIRIDEAYFSDPESENILYFFKVIE